MKAKSKTPNDGRELYIVWARDDPQASGRYEAPEIPRSIQLLDLDPVKLINPVNELEIKQEPIADILSLASEELLASGERDIGSQVNRSPRKASDQSASTRQSRAHRTWDVTTPNSLEEFQGRSSHHDDGDLDIDFQQSERMPNSVSDDNADDSVLALAATAKRKRDQTGTRGKTTCNFLPLDTNATGSSRDSKNSGNADRMNEKRKIAHQEEAQSSSANRNNEQISPAGERKTRLERGSRQLPILAQPNRKEDVLTPEFEDFTHDDSSCSTTSTSKIEIKRLPETFDEMQLRFSQSDTPVLDFFEEFGQSGLFQIRHRRRGKAHRDIMERLQIFDSGNHLTVQVRRRPGSIEKPLNYDLHNDRDGLAPKLDALLPREEKTGELHQIRRVVDELLRPLAGENWRKFPQLQKCAFMKPWIPST